MKATKAFDKQVEEMEKQLDASNNAKNNAASQLDASEKREEMGAKIKTLSPAQIIWQDFEKTYCLIIAKKVISKCNYPYSFEDAAKVTEDFTKWFTSSEDKTTKTTSFAGKQIYFKSFAPVSVSDVLKCFEQSKIYFDTQVNAVKKEQRKQEKAKEERQDKINSVANDLDMLIEAMAKCWGCSIEEAKRRNEAMKNA